MMKTIISPQNDLVKLAVSLHLKKYRDEYGLFLVEGQGMILMALKYGWDADVIFIHQEDQIAQDLLLNYENQIVLTSDEILEKISKKDNPQPVIGVFKQRHAAALPDKFDLPVPALEEIRDPGNLGTIMRSCHALGIETIVLVGNCCDPFSPETVRASMGSFAAVTAFPITQEDFIRWVQQRMNLPIIGTDVQDATDYRHISYQGAVVLMGNEQKGLSKQLREVCTMRAHIPMPGGTESLNVAIATTLLLYEARRPYL
jgi:RNA methyltransferase, TrmH family